MYGLKVAKEFIWNLLQNNYIFSKENINLLFSFVSGNQDKILYITHSHTNKSSSMRVKECENWTLPQRLV